MLTSPDYEVESVHHVLKRMLTLIEYLERKYRGKKILFVSHEDPLHILEAYSRGISPYLHRRIKHLKPGEIRELKAG